MADEQTRLEMRLEAPRLAGSAMITNLGPGERSLWRFSVALFVGLAVFVLVGVISIVAVLALYIFVFGWPNPTTAGPAALVERFSALARSDGRNLADELEIIGIGLTSNILPMFAFV